MKSIKLAILSTILLASVSQANVFWNGYSWVGNICRSGGYWSVVPYNPVGAVCYNYASGTYGYISNE